MDLQLGVLPEMDREAPGLFTASERIIQDFASEKKVDATFIKDLIQKVLHHPDFDPDDVDHDMHELLMAAIEEGDLEVIDLKEDGDGNQDVRLFKRPLPTSWQSAQGAVVRSKAGRVPALCLQGIQGRKRSSNPWGACKWLGLISTGPAQSWQGHSFYLNSAVHRRYITC